jgi:diphthamide biosynthesis methyltransferase
MTTTKNGKETSVDIVRAFDMGRHNTLYLTISKDARRDLDIKKGAKFLLKIDSEGRLVYEPLREQADKRGANDER